ncbi:DUF4142 domain-containing protein [Pseudoxanthomonas daejeonensis]|uniref:DUF4142 domain-containing protein n=1 Tax=Pseudoxanthomonas daejeonensis TaxID=266062 RepID=A0ABQ6ZBM1_9GAMM|nr:DUF4142 domain-containing protein [Pseudoxanthomonas daejeonensis]KAF1697036.1 hypothetical protein CSC65_03115 [Pseudoxanthomonas daejeonensis]UNK56349.1 DUF4142 domain-containing protein [Pseudoxanthomonas daejeonensis]
MKSNLLALAVIALGTSGLVGCQRDDDRLTGAERAASTQPEPAPADSAGDAAGPGAATSDEGAALAVLNAINSHEIAAGQQALAKGVKGDVAAYAQMMIDQHGENRSKTTALGPDENAPEAVAQRSKGEQELAALDRVAGDGYAKAYVDAMVKGHAEALDVLDSRLIPSATRPEVKAHLVVAREHVANHLKQAEALRAATGG